MCCSGYKALSTLFSHLLPHRESHLLVVGLDNAGKTTFVSNLAMAAECVKSKTSEGIGVTLFRFKRMNFRFLDFCGESKLRSTWSNYYSYADIVIFVIDSYDAARLAEARCVLCDVLLEKRLKNVPLLVMANKQDMNRALSITELTELLGLGRITDRIWMIQESSAVTGTGIHEAFNWIYNTVRGVN